MTALLVLAACSHPRGPAVERLAILPFSNLTGDAALDWLVNAGPAMLSEELAGAARLLPQHSSTVGLAESEGAAKILHCTYTQRGTAVEIQYAIEDAGRNRMTAAGSVTGTALFAVGALARKLDAAATPFSTPNSDAVSAWGRGEFERALVLDPDFGTAWAAWIEDTAKAGKTEEAQARAARALARGSLRGPLSKAQIQLSLGVLRKDDNARMAALTEILRLAPHNSAALLQMADIQQRNRKYSAAEELYRRVLEMEPGNAATMNALGYAQGENGETDAAAKTLAAYGHFPGQAGNALDSLGEIYFMNGRFGDAEKSFLQLSAREPNFLNGAPMMKAAYSHWLGGDLAGADALMQKYLEFRTQQNDSLAFWREAVWLYATGRPEQALTALGKAPPAQAANMERQRAVWRGQIHPPDDLNQLKTAYENTNRAADGLARTFYAAELARAGRTEEARALLQLWPLPDSASDPFFQSLIYPRFLELRKSLKVGL